MNAAQRRQFKRKFPHIIKLMAEAGKHFFEHDDKVLVARHWCKCNCRDGYIVDTKWDLAEFKFSTEKDAVHFALKWL